MFVGCPCAWKSPVEVGVHGGQLWDDVVPVSGDGSNCRILRSHRWVLSSGLRTGWLWLGGDYGGIHIGGGVAGDSDVDDR